MRPTDTCGKWTTADEADYLSELAAAENWRALRGWLEAATHYARDWGSMDPAVLIGYAQELLDGQEA